MPDSFFLFSECCNDCHKRCEEDREAGEKLCCPVCHAPAVKEDDNGLCPQTGTVFWAAVSSLFAGAALLGGFVSGYFA